MRYTINIMGILLYISTEVMATTYYVSNLGHHQEPFTNWYMAATNLQTAVDWANTNDANHTVMVSNGVYLLDGQISVSNVVVRGFTADSSDVIIDGGNYAGRLLTNRCFLLNHSNALLAFVTITNGFAGADSLPLPWGGAVFIDAGGGVVSNCAMMFNRASNGGGAAMRDTNGLIVGCSVISNTAGAAGGGIAFWYNGHVLNCEIVANVATTRAGGIDVNNGGLIENTIITGNESHGTDSTSMGGGAVYLRNGILRNCLIYDNWSSSHGAVYVRDVSFIQNSTIVSNRKVNATRPGGIYFASPSTGQVENSIVYFNDNPQWTAHGLAIYTFSNCCSSTDSGAGNITADPQFVGIDGERFDYHLQITSPCVNTGVSRIWMQSAADLDGHRRIDRFSGLPDMGAYERVGVGTMMIVY